MGSPKKDVSKAEAARATALARVTRAAERHARNCGFILQPDPAQLAYVLGGLARNLVDHGRPYCPCREVTGDAEKDKSNICPCRTHREEIERVGECECGLFVRRAGGAGEKVGK